MSGSFLDGLLVSVSGLLIIAGVIALLYVVALWCIFTKAGEPGWKSIIPLYNTYTLYKIGWSMKYFWISMAATFISEILVTQVGSEYSGTIMAISGLIGFVTLIINVLFNLNVARRFGYGTGFGIGLLFLPSIFMLILAFGSNEYDPNAEVINLPVID